jgi:hypothetical protein
MNFKWLSDGDSFMDIVQAIRNAVILIEITRPNGALRAGDKFSSIIAAFEVHHQRIV